MGYRLRIDAGDLAPPASAQESADQHRRQGGIGTYAKLAAPALTLASAAVFALNGLVTPKAAPRSASGATELEPAARDLAIRRAAAAFEQTATQQAQAIRYFQVAVGIEPESPTLWGSLALNYAIALPYARPEEQDHLVDRVRQAAQRSLALNPHEGHALTALTHTQPTFRNWARKEPLYRRAMAKSDAGSSAPTIHYARFLSSVGRTSDALREAERAMKSHPLVPWLNVNLIELLAVNGRLDEAERTARRAAELWPRNHDLWITRAFLFAFNGQTDCAIAMIDDRDRWPEGARASNMMLIRRVAETAASRSAADVDDVLASYSRLASEGQAYAEQAIRVAARLGRPEAALRFATDLYLRADAPAEANRFVSHVEYGRQGERATAALFLSPANRL